MSIQNSYDVAVLGAGIGGYVFSIRASQLGKRVILIEKEEIGGTCLNWGCIPTKTVLATTNLLSKMNKCNEFGISIKEMQIDLSKIIARKDSIVEKFKNGVQFLLKKNNVKIVKGKGIIENRNTIKITTENDSDERIAADNIVIASGLVQDTPFIVKNGKKQVLTIKKALTIKDIPKSMAILGGGPIGVEFAFFFNSLGTKMHLITDSKRILPKFDKDVERYVQRIMRSKEINIITESQIELVEYERKSIRIIIVARGQNQQIDTEELLDASNMRPRTKGIGIENLGIRLSNEFVVVDEHMRTNVPGVYAIGDVTGGTALAHKAAAQGIVAAENIAGLESVVDHKLIPNCIYTSPEIACLGLSEDEAIKQGYDVSMGKFPFLANGRALTLGSKEGFVKIVSDKETDEILGVHIIAERATDMIGEALIAMHLESTSEELGRTIHPHPTLSEAIMEAAQAVSGKAIHI